MRDLKKLKDNTIPLEQSIGVDSQLQFRINPDGEFSCWGTGDVRGAWASCSNPAMDTNEHVAASEHGHNSREHD